MYNMDNCEDSSCYRVLSIQSHVVSGYVGNKSACFPLQVLGFEVDFINSVQLSNHTGYEHVKGQNLDADDLQDIFEGLKLNNLTSYTHILTGYVRSESFLRKLVDIVQELKRLNPSLYYVCDPVMGDNGQWYVPEELLPIYRDNVLPLANVITPNQYEAELLTGIVIKTKEDVLQVMDIFHKKGVETVVLSSAVLEKSDKLQLFGSSVKDGTRSVISMEIPKLPASFTGTGDLFSALLLAWMAKTKGNLKLSCENVVNTISCILNRTLEFAEGAVDPMKIELKLIQSKRDIENPPTVLKCCMI